MIITLFDMSSMFGLPPNGEEVIDLLSAEDGIGLALAKKDTTYGSLVNTAALLVQ